MTEALRVELIPLLQDNYSYLLQEPHTRTCTIIDPPEAKPILQLLSQKNLSLQSIFCTHHHADHTGGCLELQHHTQCAIYGPLQEASRIPGLNHPLKEGDSVYIGEHHATILETPGHTLGQIAYWFEKDALLFCGDTLFSLGCGRIFEGTFAQMWNSLLKLRALPPSTRVYCGHEYTLNNARFALTLDPNNKDLQKRAIEVEMLQKQNLPSIPSTLELECLTNPFLRCDNPELQLALNMKGADPLDVFSFIRKQKDNF